MSKVSKKTWMKIRTEYRTSEISIKKLAEKFNLSRAAIHQKIKKEMWTRDIKEKIDMEMEQKINEMLMGTEYEFDAEIQKRLDILLKHRQQWELPIRILESAIEYDADGNVVRTVKELVLQAKQIAETLEIVQRSERIAWGIDDHFGTLTELQIQNRNKLLQMCLDNEIDSVAQAAILFDIAGISMPKSIEMMLKRTPIDKPEPVVDDVFTEEELDAEYEAKMQEIEQQRKQWLPERVKGIEQIKHEMKDGDSFSSDFQIKNDNKKDE